MPLEILSGSDVPALLARAQQLLGDEAVVMSVRSVRTGRTTGFEMVAADPATADLQRRREQLARGAAGAAAPPGPALPASATAPRPAAPRGPSPTPAVRHAGPPAKPARELRRPRVIVLVGPTGAGKTTTIAKLANHPQAFGGRRVGLLCLDTYRIGGVEQSRQYAEISRLPLEVVWEPRDVAGAMRRLRDRDVILVDTPGRGPRAADDLRETQARLLELPPDEVHLVLPAGLQRAFARRVVTAHLPLGVTHLLPTKLDEYPDERGVFGLAAQFGLPMRWLTDGQEVPRDLQPAPDAPALHARTAAEMEVS